MVIYQFLNFNLKLFLFSNFRKLRIIQFLNPISANKKKNGKNYKKSANFSEKHFTEHGDIYALIKRLIKK